ncbi:hypothetical protein OHD62_23720 [Mesorhizobium sp. YC-39]|uniref:hypothetical protein n=1 Tax=unclassified Mesorhizobium TaxID=325217 RepID=UPI0021E6DCA6|nr:MULTISPECIES: hypothetical protein [unclassified Mesorhizobium]MCV3209257.1 hypothetical protein [Mesorhizobium sp. YC-2]MCV3231393.1 hypothetical protein [Mesorhizobium sp. YC-39]
MSDQDTNSRSKGMELFELTPIAVGGDPVSMENKTWLTRQEHFEAVRYWNRTIEIQRKAALEKAGRNGE